MSKQEDDGPLRHMEARAQGQPGDMDRLIERIHATADHLCVLVDGGFVGFEHKRLTSISFLVQLMREDALMLHALHAQAKKNPTR